MQNSPYNASNALDERIVSSPNAMQTLVRFLNLLRRRKNVLWCALLATFTAGLVYYAVAPRYYESVAKLMIIVQQGTDQVSTMSEQSNSDNVMASQRELVRSPKVIQAAIESLDPEFQVDLVDEAPRNWVTSISERLSTSTVRKTNHMQVRYLSRQPEAAAAVVDAVIDSYLSFVEKTHQGAATKVLAGQQRRLDALEEKLAGKQQRLEHLRANLEALTPTGNSEVVDPVVSEAIYLHEALMELRKQRLEGQASLATVEQALRNGEDVRRHMGLVQEAVGEQVLLSSLGLSPQDAEIQTEQQKQLLANEDELRRIAPYLGAQHPKTIALSNRINATRQYLASYKSSFGDRLQSLSNAEIGPLLVEVLSQSVNRMYLKEQQLTVSYDTAFKEATRKSSEINELAALQREVEQLELDRHAYDQKIAEVDVHQLLAPIQATIVQDPLPAEKPATPKIKEVLVMSALAGLIIGSLIIYTQDMLDDRFGSPEEMAAQLGLPVLSLVRTLQPTGGTGLDAVHMHAGGEMVELEAFRTLRTALTLNGQSADRLVVSSTEPSDGKTTVSANLAVSLAQAGNRTLVIDGDLRRPGMTALMDMKGKAGLTDLLVTDGKVSELAEQIVHHSELEGLDIIPAGPRRPDPAELLAGKNFVDLLAWADSRYDKVLIDCPPVLAVSDAQITGRLVDGVMIVVSPEKNHRRLVARACENFLNAGVHVFGVVANRISEESSAGYGYGYTYDYGSSAEEYSEADDAPETASSVAFDIGGSQLSTKSAAGLRAGDQRAA